MNILCQSSIDRADQYHSTFVPVGNPPTCYLLHHQKVGVNIEPHGAIEPRKFHFQKRLVDIRSCIADQHVDRTVILVSSIHKFLDAARRVLQQIMRHQMNRVACLLAPRDRFPCRRVLVQTMQNKVAPKVGEMFGDRPTDTLGRTGDQDGLA